LKSFSVANRKTFLSGLPPGRFSKDFGGETTVPKPSPCSVSTMTWSPRFRTNAPLSKLYTLPAVLNLIPTIFFMVFMSYHRALRAHRENNLIVFWYFCYFNSISVISEVSVVIKLNCLRSCQVYEQTFHGES